MTSSALRELLNRARGPLGPRVELDFGVTGGPMAELAAVLSEINGFFAFNGGIHIFRVGDEGMGYDLQTWNRPDTWIEHYQGLFDNVFCFGQDLFGFQFGIVDGRSVAVVDPETGAQESLGNSLEDWASWLLADADRNGRSAMAAGWNQQYGALPVTDRLIYKQLLVMGGENEVANVVAKDAVECMRIRGPIAAAIRDLPDGAQIRLTTD